MCGYTLTYSESIRKEDDVTIQILDIYQGNKFNADLEFATGTDAVLIKGGQGQYQDYMDHQSRYIDECSRVGLPHGIFWQMDARYSPESHKAAIKVFHDKIGFGELGLWLACEKPFYPLPDWLYSRMPYAYYKPIESVWRGIGEWIGLDLYPGIYTSPSMWNLIFGRCPLALQQEFATRSKLWVAQYGVTVPNKIGQWPAWWFWQYEAEPDYSVFAGSEEQFKLEYPSPLNPPSPPPTPTPSVDRVTVLDEAIKAIEAIK